MSPEETMFGGQSPNLDIDDIMHLLSNRRRRVALEMIEDGESIELGTVAEEIAKVEDHENFTDQRERVYIALLQCHLPKLDQYQVVDFDDDRKVIKQGENLKEVSGMWSHVKEWLK